MFTIPFQYTSSSLLFPTRMSKIFLYAGLSLWCPLFPTVLFPVLIQATGLNLPIHVPLLIAVVISCKHLLSLKKKKKKKEKHLKYKFKCGHIVFNCIPKLWTLTHTCLVWIISVSIQISTLFLKWKARVKKIWWCSGKILEEHYILRHLGDQLTRLYRSKCKNI